MNRLLFCFLVSLVLIHHRSGLAVSDITIVPKPHLVQPGTGVFCFHQNSIRVRIADTDTSHHRMSIKQLDQLIRENNGVPLWQKNESEFLIWVGFPEQDQEFRNLCQKEDLWPEDRIGEEGYILDIREKRIIIAANTPAGVFYAVQSLKQLVRGSNSPHVVCLRIIDWPEFQYRGVMDDISRGPVPTLEYMKTQIRRLSELKINLFTHYVEHVVKTESHGDFAPAGGSLTIDEWKKITDYAANYHMDIMGNFQSLGHFEKILAFPQYRHLGETDRMLNPMSNEAHRFLADIYKEMIPAFSSPIFNVNCDETWDIGRGPSKKYVDSLGVAWVYARHINALYDIVSGLGKRMLIWGDIVLQHPEILQMIPQDIIIGTWGYDARDSFDDCLKPFADQGFDFLFSCGVLNSNRLMPDYRMTMGNIRQFAKDASRYNSLGMVNTVWDDGGKALFSLDWYGIGYAADHAWFPNDESVDTFTNRFEGGVYGNQGASVGQVLNSLTRLTDLPQTFELNEAIFWKTLIPERGESLQLDPSGWDHVIDICNQSEEALDRADPQVYESDLKAIRFTIDQFRFMAEARHIILATAENYHKACLLQKKDRATTRVLLVDAITQLSKVIQSVSTLRHTFQSLWLEENRAYWLDRILDLYDGHIQSLTDTKALLSNSLKSFDNGHALAAPMHIRLDISGANGRYFQYWLLAGPFPNPGGTAYEHDYLTPAGGELHVRPFPGDAFTAESGELIRWQKFESPDYTTIKLSHYYEKNIEVLAYAYCRIHSPMAQTVRATFGSNDGIEIVLNDRLVFERHTIRSLIPDEEEIRLSLRAGWNHLLLKIDQKNGDWGFSFQLPDVQVRNHKYKYYIQ
ncbi:hypothetical protein EH223_12675 [candidate division KSB1 bacterium]|nr:family 20 glycosylhydrolase [candidate division KSB1 bacterium]RQW02339.1 MAG: hypothetical protein EH223_12675 [candidate division KSB1 bacterium]